MNELELIKEEIAATIRAYNQKGWSPATSTNYSFRTIMDDETIYVSRSGVDKSLFSSSDFITVNRNGNPIGEDVESVPSAETLIHCILYDCRTSTESFLSVAVFIVAANYFSLTF